MAEEDDASARSDGVVKEIEDLGRIFYGTRQRDPFYDDAVAFGFEVPGMFAAGMLLIGHQDFVAGFEVDAVGDVAISFGGITKQGDFVAMTADKGGQGSRNSFQAAYPQMG